MKTKQTQTPEQAARAFAGDLERALGARLESVLLYGSAARGEHIAGLSDINVLVLVDDINGASLTATAPLVRSHAMHGIHPIMVESREWRRAADVFSIEISDMQDAHVAVHGSDPVGLVTILPADLRLQAERELRGKLLQIYKTMMISEKPEDVGAVLIGAVPSMVTYFRTALRLAERAVPQDSREVLETAADLTGADVTALLRILDARRNGGALAVSLADPIVDEFNTSTETLVKFIDTFGR